MKKSKVTVLVVDDDADFVASTKLALEAQGYSVIVAYNGGEALQAVRKEKVDVVILDVIMDSPNEGFEVARQMRNDPKTKTIPLIMLTSVNEVNRRAGYKFRFSEQDRDDTWLPVDKFLDKPVSPQKLGETVKACLKGG